MQGTAKSAMTPEKWARLRDLFECAMELDPSEWSRFAGEACAGDEDLRAELLRLLENDADAESFWSNPPVPTLPTSTWTPGTMVLGRFRIVRFVGRGGMGEVYEARDGLLNQKVALKTIRPEAASDAHVLARFKQEINLARKVTDAHVSRIYEIFTEPVPFLTMEFLEGVTLSQKIRRDGPLPEAETRCIALQLCQALEAAHKAGVVHRDFKSGNVMVRTAADRLPWAVVTDFGLATMATLPESETVSIGLTRPGAIMGTPPYMAPEQLEGGVAGPATDLYALGIVLYEMLTGRTPFEGGSPVVAAVERLKHRPDPPSSVVPGLNAVWDRVIGRCLEYEKEKRPGSAAEVATLLSGERVRGSLLRIPWKLSRRSVGILGVVLLLVVCGFAGWTRWGRSYHPPSDEAEHRYEEGTAALHDGTYLKAALALERAVALDKNFVLAHARLADAYTELDYTEKAKDEILQASSLELLENLPHLDKDYVEAVRSTIMGRFPDAVARYRRILDALPSSDKIYGLVDLGRAYEKAGQNDQAISSYEQAASRSSEYPACFLRLGVLYSLKNRQTEATSAFNRAEEIYQASSNLEGRAEVELQEGLAANTQDRSVAAREYTEKALAAARTIPSPQLEMRALVQLAAVEYKSGDTARAADDANRAMKLAQDNGVGTFWSIQVQIQLGNTYLAADDYAKAESYYLPALQLARKSGSERLEALASVNLASLRDKQDRTAEGLPLSEFAFKYYQNHGFVTHANLALVLLARARLEQGALDDALKSYQDMAARGRAAMDSIMTSDAEEGIGDVFDRRDDYPEALKHYQSALEASKGRDPGFVGYQAFHCATVLSELGRYEEAEAMLARAKAAEKAQQDLAPEIETLLAAMALSRRQNAEAREYSRSAINSKVSYSPATFVEATYYLCLAQVRSGSVSAGVTTCRSALSRAQDLAKGQIPGASLALGEALYMAGSLPEAETLTKASVEAFHRQAQQDSEWRALLLLSRILRKTAPANSTVTARNALDILQHLDHNWDAPNSRSYQQRPDVQAAKAELAVLLRTN